MKRLLLIFILTFSFHTLTKADDISDFQIEGISIGDSILKYYNREDLNKYKEREGLHIQTENQLKGTKQIVIEMSGAIRELKTQNDNFQAEIARLNEEIQLLELQIKK